MKNIKLCMKQVFLLALMASAYTARAQTPETKGQVRIHIVKNENGKQIETDTTCQLNAVDGNIDKLLQQYKVNADGKKMSTRIVVSDTTGLPKLDEKLVKEIRQYIKLDVQGNDSLVNVMFQADGKQVRTIIHCCKEPM